MLREGKREEEREKEIFVRMLKDCLIVISLGNLIVIIISYLSGKLLLRKNKWILGSFVTY